MCISSKVLLEMYVNAGPKIIARLLFPIEHFGELAIL